MEEDTNVSSFGEKLDAIGNHMTGLHGKIDTIREGHEAHGKKLDALAKRIDALEDGAGDDDEDAREDRERRDARERDDAKRRADGGSETEEERSRRHEAEDAAWQAGASERRDARRRRAADAVAERERGTRADARRHELRADSLNETNRAQFVDAQVRADSAYQAMLFQQAPYAQYGETLRDFRERLLVPLKRHSKLYKDSTLASIADETAFSVMEAQIFADAIKASRDVSSIGAGSLRKEVTRKPTGHTETRYYGDSAVTWAPFSGGGVQFVKFNSELARAAQIAAAARGRQ